MLPWEGKETGPSPVDRGKEGVKRSSLTEADGIPLAIELAPANRHDMKLVMLTLAKMMRVSPKHDQASKLYLDLGYDYEEVRQIVRLAGLDR